MDGLETFGPHPEIWPFKLSPALPAAGALGSWPALGRKPAISTALGTKMEAIGMMLKAAESWDGFGSDRRSSPIWPNGASGRSLALAVFRLGSINCLRRWKIGRPGTGGLEIGRLWQGLVRVPPGRTPRTLPAGKVLELEFGLNTPQPPALPDAADARDAPAAQFALKLRRAR